MNVDSDQDVYARLLTFTEPRCGYPLWFPEPSMGLPLEYYRDGVQIGDVGVITTHGSFDVFFNICLPVDHPLRDYYGVPEGFKQIRLSDRDVEVATRSITQNDMVIEALGGNISTSVHSANLCLYKLNCVFIGQYPCKAVSAVNSARLHLKAQYSYSQKEQINVISAVIWFSKGGLY